MGLKSSRSRNSTATAAELTQEQVQKVLVKPLEQASVFLAAGVRYFDTNGSPVRIPKLGGPTSPSFVGENEEIPEVDPSFDEITLLPSTLKSVKTLTRFSNELARQSVACEPPRQRAGTRLQRLLTESLERLGVREHTSRKAAQSPARERRAPQRNAARPVGERPVQRMRVRVGALRVQPDRPLGHRPLTQQPAHVQTPSRLSNS